MIYIIGASGHGKVVLDSLVRNGITVEGFIDDDETKTTFLGYPVLRRSQLPKHAELVWGIGNGEIRKRVQNQVTNRFLSNTDPSSIVSDRAVIGEGTVVLHGAIVQSDSAIGKHCIVNTKASVDHDCRIGDFTHIAPGATICGGVTIGKNCWIGAGATIIQGVRLGDNVVVGAGATVLHSFGDAITLVGTPAKNIKNN